MSNPALADFTVEELQAEVNARAADTRAAEVIAVRDAIQAAIGSPTKRWQVTKVLPNGRTELSGEVYENHLLDAAAVVLSAAPLLPGLILKPLSPKTVVEDTTFVVNGPRNIFIEFPSNIAAALNLHSSSVLADGIIAWINTEATVNTTPTFEGRASGGIGLVATLLKTPV